MIIPVDTMPMRHGQRPMLFRSFRGDNMRPSTLTHAFSTEDHTAEGTPSLSFISTCH